MPSRDCHDSIGTPGAVHGGKASTGPSCNHNGVRQEIESARNLLLYYAHRSGVRGHVMRGSHPQKQQRRESKECEAWRPHHP